MIITNKYGTIFSKIVTIFAALPSHVDMSPALIAPPPPISRMLMQGPHRSIGLLTGLLLPLRQLQLDAAVVGVGLVGGAGV